MYLSSFRYSLLNLTAGLSDAQIIGIVFGILGFIVVVFLFIVCCCAVVIRHRQRNMLLYSKPRSYDIADDRQRVLYNVPRAQRTGRSDFRHNDGSEQYRLPSYLFDSEIDSSDRTSDITEEDRHMQQLAEVITQSPYLNVSSDFD